MMQFPDFKWCLVKQFSRAYFIMLQVQPYRDKLRGCTFYFLVLIIYNLNIGYVGLTYSFI